MGGRVECKVLATRGGRCVDMLASLDMHSWLHSRAPVWWWAGRRTLRDCPCTAFCIAWEGRWEGVKG